MDSPHISYPIVEDVVVLELVVMIARSHVNIHKVEATVELLCWAHLEHPDPRL